MVTRFLGRFLGALQRKSKKDLPSTQVDRAPTFAHAKIIENLRHLEEHFPDNPDVHVFGRYLAEYLPSQFTAGEFSRHAINASNVLGVNIRTARNENARKLEPGKTRDLKFWKTFNEAHNHFDEDILRVSGIQELIPAIAKKVAPKSFAEQVANALDRTLRPATPMRP
ncbi:MAG: hypothetical protein Q8P02_02485 [Candidatus Micrarchaeota archaeon]|nr:hypothetical protein [Candidatus Micrarchaeota archaeon]